MVPGLYWVGHWPLSPGSWGELVFPASARPFDVVCPGLFVLLQIGFPLCPPVVLGVQVRRQFLCVGTALAARYSCKLDFVLLAWAGTYKNS